MREIKEKIMSSAALVRSGLYALENIPSSTIGRLISGEQDRPSPEEFRVMWDRLKELHQREARHILDGVYPITAMDAVMPWTHLRSYAGVLADGLRVSFRMRKKNHADFDVKARAHGEGLPDYYLRNFHFQTDGYLSEKSARRYDHQVDILFAGTAGAMRRQILPPLKKLAKPDGCFLDLGAGAGSSTRPVLVTFPKARVTALDMSGPYLKVAQERLRKFPRVDYTRGDATDLHFRDGSFDAVYSVFVLHEVPAAEREQLVREAWRVLKPGGVMVLADSIQPGDDPALDQRLEVFPRVFHEPFYKNYAGDRLETLVERVSGRAPETDLAFFTKVVWLQKPQA